MKTKAKVGNTYGKNAFREVKVRCTECGGTTKPMMQCDTGRYQWECDLCGYETTHTVTETEPMR